MNFNKTVPSKCNRSGTIDGGHHPNLNFMKGNTNQHSTHRNTMPSGPREPNDFSKTDPGHRGSNLLQQMIYGNESNKEPTDFEKNQKLKKEMEDHYDVQISKLYSQRAPCYLLEDQPKRQNLETCDHLLKKVGDTNNQVGVPSTVLDKEILRIFNNQRLTKTGTKVQPQNIVFNMIKVFGQNDKSESEQLGTSLEEEVDRSSKVYRDLFEKQAAIQEKPVPLRKSCYRNKQYLKAANDVLKAWKLKKTTTNVKERDKIDTPKQLQQNSAIPEKSTGILKSKVVRKLKSRFQIQDLDTIFEPITFSDDYSPLPDQRKNMAVTQSLNVKSIFDIDQSIVLNEFHKKNCQSNCKIYINSTTRSPFLKIFSENGYLPKRYQSKDNSAPKFSVFADSQDHSKKCQVHTLGGNPRANFTIKDSKLINRAVSIPDYLQLQKETRAKRKLTADAVFQAFN